MKHFFTLIALTFCSTGVLGQRYLGQINNNPYDPNSISNPYGRYGNPYSADSINNPYGAGNPYNARVLKVYDSNGNFKGNLNTNQYDPDSISNPYGRYGNPYSPDSINNPYGAGNPYNTGNGFGVYEDE